MHTHRTRTSSIMHGHTQHLFIRRIILKQRRLKNLFSLTHISFFLPILFERELFVVSLKHFMISIIHASNTTGVVVK